MTSEFDTPASVVARIEALQRRGKLDLARDGLVLLGQWISEMHELAHDLARGAPVFLSKGHRIASIPKTDHFPRAYGGTARTLDLLDTWLHKTDPEVA